MSPFLVIFTPFARLVGHSLAATFGFSGAIAVLPVQVLKLLSTYSSLDSDAIKLFELIESGILYLDAMLLLFVIFIYSLYFVVEQWRALLLLLRGVPT